MEDIKPTDSNQSIDRPITKADLLARIDQATKLTLVHSSSEGFVNKQRGVVRWDDRGIVMTQMDAAGSPTKARSEPTELTFEEGDTFTERMEGSALTFTVHKADRSTATYKWGW